MTGTAEQIAVWLMRQEDRKKVYDITEHRIRRSMDSNAYFHVLCDKLRQALGISMARCKNHLIADYGQIEYIEEGEPLIYKTNAPEEWMMERETLHSKCVKVIQENGHDVFFYRIYRGSHTYNTAEMSQLIKGTVEECKAQGIETATPDELAKMAEMWERRNAQKNKSLRNNSEGQGKGRG